MRFVGIRTCAAALLLLGTVFSARVAMALPVVTFYNNRAAWDLAVSSQTLINFEGIVADNTFVDFGPDENIDGVRFAEAPGFNPGQLIVSGFNGGLSGAPYNSALVMSGNSGALTADLTPLRANFTAIGGFFGNIQTTDAASQLTLVGTTGVLDVRVVTAGDMGQGNPEVFLGYTVIGDTIDTMTISNGDFEGLDDFVYGQAIPEPATLAVGSVLVILLAPRRRRAA